MSLVGTRPILQDELLKYELHHRARIAIKPGITGMWQVSGRSDITDFEEVVRLDTEYISKEAMTVFPVEFSLRSPVERTALRNMLLQEQKHLQEIADKARRGLSVEPEGHLRISNDKNKPRYYQCIDNNNEIYIPRSNKKLPKLLAQSTYNRTVLKKVETRLKQIKKILQDYTDDEIERIYTSMHKERQLLVTPIEPTFLLFFFVTFRYWRFNPSMIFVVYILRLISLEN